MAAPGDISQIRTGTLRRDIEIIPPGRHGAYPMIFDPAAESYYKLTVPAWKMLSRYGRDCTVLEMCRRLQRAGLPAEPEEVLILKQFLLQNNLLTPDADTFAQQADNRRNMKSKGLWLKVASAYLYFKLPPSHPQPFIDRVKPYIGFIGSKYFFRLLLIPAVIGYILVFRQLPAVTAALAASFTWAGLVKYFFAIILLKIIHEGGHLAGNMRFNCRVRAIGISVIFLYPRFFSDTTDSWRLPRRQRLLIDAGGLLSEMLCGGLAALAWCYLPPGNLQSTMFFIFAVSTASTILVNGNPLIRFDGYYILCDILGVENLMQRSGEYIKQLNRHYLFGLGAKPEEERPFLMFAFGIAAFIYRFLLYTSIILVIYNSMVKVVGIFLLFMEVLTIFILPLYHEVRVVGMLSKRAGRRANLTFVFVLLAAGAFVLFFPLSWRSTLPGKIRSASSVLAALPEAGYVTENMTGQPVSVKKGGVLLALESPLLEMELLRCRTKLEEELLLFDQQRASEKTMGDSMLTLKRIQTLRRSVDELVSRRKQLTFRSGTDGVFVPVFSHLSRGAFLPRGMLAGVIHAGRMRVDAYAQDHQLKRLRPGMKVRIKLKDTLADAAGTIERINPVPVTFTDSPLLNVSGGDIPVFPVPGKKGEFTPEHPVFRVEIRPDEPLPFQSGRTLRVTVENREVLLDKLVSSVLYFFRSEF